MDAHEYLGSTLPHGGPFDIPRPNPYNLALHDRVPFGEISTNTGPLDKGSFSFTPAECGGRLRSSVSSRMRSTRHEPLWQPTRLTSPYCVLSANGVEDDYYSSCLSWGRENLALALRDEVLLFQPTRPMSRPAVWNVQDRHALSSDRAAPSRVTSVAISRFSDGVCFLGELDGSIGTYQSRGDGRLVPTAHFAMPPPPLEHVPFPAAALWAATASVQCLATTNAHPHLVAAGTAAQGVFLLDGRATAPAAQFNAGGATRGDGPQAAMAFLSAARSVCGAAWNASGSLVAAGGADGAVEIWSPSQPRAPLQTVRLPGAHTAARAVAFHPTNPYELAVGGGAGDGGLRVFDVSSAAARVGWATATGCQVTQTLYSPDGAFLLSAHGARQTTAAASPQVDGHEAVAPFSLVVWRKAGAGRSAPVPHVRVPHEAPPPLLSLYAMPGHRARPLHLTAPFSQAACQGCVASVAGGADSTIRFWRAFRSRSEAANWEQRTSASLLSATTDEDVEGVVAHPLR